MVTDEATQQSFKKHRKGWSGCNTRLIGLPLCAIDLFCPFWGRWSRVAVAMMRLSRQAAMRQTIIDSNICEIFANDRGLGTE